MSCTCFGASSVRRNRTGNLAQQESFDARENSIARTRNFSYAELRAATNNFGQVNKIGRGGFGTVYKGTLKNGRRVAVKALSAQSKQGIREFLTEIETVSNARHTNLVELIGCCVHENNRILVYEYLENRSLDRVLFGQSGAVKLEWHTRAAICVGTARGLTYLHEEVEPHIVHRDIKASNILLDKDYTPKIGDFGLAKLFPDNITHISTQIAGTCGYLAPEYVLAGQLTMKADVYSFGVLILEVVSGRSSSSMNWGGQQKALLERAWNLYEEGNMLELVDSELEKFPKEEVLKYMKVALLCTQASAGRRPMMSQVVDMLTRDVQINEKELQPPSLFQSSDDDKPAVMLLKQRLTETSTSYLGNSVTLPITEVIPR
ncbi:cold-responsive protein kinase 1-like isoform X1 [Ipomoea triloba]|uniref:cold-responsive protein kinase 1-like isoform X1 n=1 Tax=Ipomoea triloba TaxID=35885 RepID=UPI00125DE4A8|nr:cold-responsive protein kinase 1-like isoform X1 [Ipomoea triloba]